MEMSRREMLATAPLGFAATGANALTLPAPSKASLVSIAHRLNVAQSSIDAATRRLDRFIPRPAALLQGRAAPGNEAAFALVTEGDQVSTEGRWTLGGPGGQIGLENAVGISSSAATLGWLDRRFRYIAGCTFGGVTLLVFGNLRAKIGILVAGQYTEIAPRYLVIQM